METVLDQARRVFRVEEEGLKTVRENLGDEFARAITILLACPSRVVITGIGKSGVVGQKIAATLNSTGSPACFLHPVEALHGDLGMVMPGDVVLAISYSGETVELNGLLGIVKKRGNPIIAMTGGRHSTMSRAADVTLNIKVPREACPLGLAPTASTTATLAMGDALAVALLNQKNFQARDFRDNHPGGSLGERLKVRVREVMLTGDAAPLVGIEESAAAALRLLNAHNLGAVIVVDDQSMPRGIITDGDIRRFFAEGGAASADFANLPTRALMTENPITIGAEALAVDALSIMQQHEITILPIISPDGPLLGVLHLHDLLGKGEFRFLL
ncbi:MAG: KpsF/GutQ family sugar-phosphate isomerase [Desulfobulbaceae bacterium]|jgi:arabinose-5-phosphate isomerase|nr:KpsF/GutQ family sugar-phosphate isomerase [Desulfobulbaceae bacterium]